MARRFASLRPKARGPLLRAVCSLCTSLLLVALGAPSASAGVNEAALFLESTQNADGSWGSDPSTSFFETTHAVKLLELAGKLGLPYQRGVQTILDAQVEGVEDLARRVDAVMPAGAPAGADLAALVLAQDAAGGFGFDAGYESNIYHTALALLALEQDPGTPGSVLTNGAVYLLGQQNMDGSFSLAANHQSTYMTAFAALALQRVGGQGGAVSSALAFLLANQYADGGFGDVASTVFETAAVLALLQETDPSGIPTADAVDYLLGEQAADGSFNGDDFETALAASSLLPSFEAAPLAGGLNFFGMPTGVAPGYSSLDLLQDLGSDALVDRIERYDPSADTFESAFYQSGLPTGDSFPIADGEGYLVYMVQDTDSYHRIAAMGTSLSLVVGANYVSFADAPTSPAIDSYDLIALIGDSTEVASLQRFDRQSGAFDTTFYSGGVAAGAQFPIEAGEAYLVYMTVAKVISDLFVVPDVMITSPLDGTTLFTATTDVSGTASANTATVDVNGVSAVVGSGTFVATAVPLLDGPNTLTALATGTNGLTAMDQITVTYVAGIDYTISPGGSASDSRTVNGDPVLLAQAAGVTVSWTGPAFLSMAISGAAFTGPDSIEIFYDIIADPSATPGVYNLDVDFGVTDSGGNPLVPLTNDIYMFSIRIL